MADFCQECSIQLFGKDMGDFAGICLDGYMLGVICEGCGPIWVDKDGKRIEFASAEIKDEH
jgi:hypothetical protein